MLYLTRKIGESVIINNDIEVKVVEVRGKTVKLGFDFPETATVLRQELHERIQNENRAALSDMADLDAFLDTSLPDDDVLDLSEE
ncbi:carbon storage regulator CsrA [Kiloniella sp. b19]|uniref:carbon storage regulator CsrA n=1 Tax=Kiloniella sp. GXU_MW_B19 TaxID=3141326 RepID=UPI0031D3B43E